MKNFLSFVFIVVVFGGLLVRVSPARACIGSPYIEDLRNLGFTFDGGVNPQIRTSVSNHGHAEIAGVSFTFIPTKGIWCRGRISNNRASDCQEDNRISKSGLKLPDGLQISSPDGKHLVLKSENSSNPSGLLIWPAANQKNIASVNYAEIKIVEGTEIIYRPVSGSFVREALGNEVRMERDEFNDLVPGTGMKTRSAMIKSKTVETKSPLANFSNFDRKSKNCKGTIDVAGLEGSRSDSGANAKAANQILEIFKKAPAKQ